MTSLQALLDEKNATDPTTMFESDEGEVKEENDPDLFKMVISVSEPNAEHKNLHGTG